MDPGGVEWNSGLRRLHKKREFYFRSKGFNTLSQALLKEPGLQEFYIGGHKIAMRESEISRVSWIKKKNFLFREEVLKEFWFI